MAEVVISGDLPVHAHQRVKTLAALAETLSRAVDEDPADAVFCLMVAAAVIALTNTNASPEAAANSVGAVVSNAFAMAGELAQPKGTVQ